jgi:hypothetical protein
VRSNYRTNTNVQAMLAAIALKAEMTASQVALRLELLKMDRVMVAYKVLKAKVRYSRSSQSPCIRRATKRRRAIGGRGNNNTEETKSRRKKLLRERKDVERHMKIIEREQLNVSEVILPQLIKCVEGVARDLKSLNAMIAHIHDLLYDVPRLNIYD